MTLDPKTYTKEVFGHGRSLARGFVQFVLRGKVVDLATAVVIGAAGGALITSFVKDLFTPLISALVGNHSQFATAHITLHGSRILYGTFINDLLSFLLVIGIVYFFVILPVNRLISNAHFAEPPDPALRKCPECISDIPREAKRCMYCTAPVAPLLDDLGQPTGGEVAANTNSPRA